MGPELQPPSAPAVLARRLFQATLTAIDVETLMRDRVRVVDGRLQVAGRGQDLAACSQVEVIAIGKAAAPMARALASILDVESGPRVAGIVVTNDPVAAVPHGFKRFVGGHPLPDHTSLAAGRAVLDRVAAVDASDTLIVFAISGGASALCESPGDPSVSLDELRSLYSELVTGGAKIADVNAVRQAVSAIKGGRLAAAAPRARQLSLLWSDVNPGDVASLGSGPTFPPGVDTWHAVLADNAVAIDAVAAIAAREFGLEVVRIDGLAEAGVAEVAAELVSTVTDAAACGRRVCVVSGGEAVCPVRGPGRGGRNQETALRVAIALDGRTSAVAVLCAGTDGIDGNSPAAGAVVDPSTVRRAAECGMDALAHLEASDSYPLFAAIGDAVETGPTGNNLRDLRIGIALPPA